MDEFEKIKELSEELDAKKGQQAESEEDMDALDDDAQLYHFRSDYRERLAQASEEGEENPSFFKQRKLLILGALILAVGIGVVYFKNARTSDEIPVIMPTSNPVKVVPDAPGGMEIPDQDKVIYDRLRQQTLDSKIESLFPEAEQPVAPPVEEGMLLQTEDSEASEIPMPVEPKPTIVNEEFGLSEDSSDETLVEAQPVQKTTQAVKESTTKKTTTKQPVKKTEDKSKTTTQKTTTTTENWSVQLMSSNNKATVQSAWPTLQKKHSALLSGLSHSIVEAKIPGKGTYYRLRVGKFSSRDQASTLCAKLKQKKQDCVPAKQ